MTPPPSPINILMILGNTGRGGSQSYVMNILRNINRQKFHIDIAVYLDKPNGYSDEIRQLGAKIITVPKFNGLNYLKCANAWRKILKNSSYHIIHAHATNAAFIPLRQARKLNIKTILHSHSAGFRGSPILKQIKALTAKLGLKYADSFCACSNQAAQKLHAHATILPNAINTSQYLFSPQTRQQIRTSLAINPNTPLIGHIGSFSQPKNHTHILKTFSQIIRQNPNAKLILCGDGPLQNKILKQIKTLNLSPHVILTGNIPNPADYLMAIDALLFPSLFEGLPVTIIEAQATGLPCIISDTITPEVQITPLITKLPLSQSPSRWASTTLAAINTNPNRQAANSLIQKSPFNMPNAIAQLQSLYTSLAI